MKSLIFVLSLLLLSAPALGQNYVRFNGGISQEERATAPDTGQRLVFFAREGKFLAQIKVVVKTLEGREMVNAVAEGPWLILNLPGGRYSVSATIANGETQSIMIDVDGSRQEFGFQFRTVE